MLCTVLPAYAATIELPRTGQNQCWDGAGALVPCVNTPGQDGAVRAGIEWPAQRFTNNGDQTINDNLTGLQWTRDTVAPTTGSCVGGNYRLWEDALTYVSCLNSTNYLGHNDWRLPNINELTSMVNPSQIHGSTWLTGQGFINVLESYYWSNTSYTFDTKYAWVAMLNNATISSTEKTGSYSIWPVRAGVPGSGSISLPATGQSLCYDHDGNEITCAGSGQDGELKKGVPTVDSGRFINNGNQTVIDSYTGLTWPQDASMPTVGTCTGDAKIWSEAPNYVACLNSANYLGFNDWRLPNMRELMSLHDRGKESPTAFDHAGFNISAPSEYSNTPIYWSSTSVTATPTQVWAVSMYDGITGSEYKDNVNSVWPVRGGLVPPPITPIAAPTEIQVLPPAAKGQLALIWVNPADATLSHIHIYRSSVAGKLGYLLADNVTGTEYTDSTVVSQYTFWYTVRAVNSIGTESGNTDQVSGTALDSTPPPMIKGGIASNPNTGGTLNLSWNALSVADLAYYRIYRSTDGVTYDLVHDNVLTHTYIDTGLTNGQEYFYSLTAMDTTGNESVMTSTGELLREQVSNGYVIKAIPTQFATTPIVGDHAGVVQLPHTGQTGCWNNTNEAIDCAGTGHDGDSRSGTPIPKHRFFDNDNGTITDTLTGLVWLKNANCFTSQTWSNALNSANTLASGSCGLTEGSVAGDWRLPNVNELESLIDLSATSPASMLNNLGFSGIQSSTFSYWTSTTSPNPGYATAIPMNGGAIDSGVSNTYKGNQNFVWAVRVAPAANIQGVSLAQTGQSTCYDAVGTVISCAGTGQDGELRKGVAWPTSRFNDNGNETVTDTLTGLMWSKDANAPGPNICNPAVIKNWQGGLDHVACLNTNSYLGHSDWRLPNRKELLSLINRGQANSATWLSSQGFSNVTTNYYHTSTAHYLPWSVLLYFGNAYPTSKASNYKIWPVRGDITPPVITSSSGPLRYSSLTSGTFAFTASETATFQCKLDSEAYATCTSPFNYSNLANGLHNLLIKATDQAGNISLPFNNTWTVNTSLIASSTILLPQTSQTRCYNTAGSQTPCADTGQDGDIQAGVPWPNPRFADNGDETITDNLTDLIWTKNANLTVRTKWQNALDYIKILNSQNYLGHNDWRLPNINELNSISSGQRGPNETWLNTQGFNNTMVDGYWSSTTSGACRTDWGWYVFMSSGQHSCTPKDVGYGYNVWPVRSKKPGSTLLPKTGQTDCYDTNGAIITCAGTGQDGELQAGSAWPTPRFNDNDNQTVTDNLTGLIWSKDANLAGLKFRHNFRNYNMTKHTVY